VGAVRELYIWEQLHVSWSRHTPLRRSDRFRERDVESKNCKIWTSFLLGFLVDGVNMMLDESDSGWQVADATTFLFLSLMRVPSACSL